MDIFFKAEGKCKKHNLGTINKSSSSKQKKSNDGPLCKRQLLMMHLNSHRRRYPRHPVEGSQEILHMCICIFTVVYVGGAQNYRMFPEIRTMAFTVGVQRYSACLRGDQRPNRVRPRSSEVIKQGGDATRHNLQALKGVDATQHNLQALKVKHKRPHRGRLCTQCPRRRSQYIYIYIYTCNRHCASITMWSASGGLAVQGASD